MLQRGLDTVEGKSWAFFSSSLGSIAFHNGKFIVESVNELSKRYVDRSAAVKIKLSIGIFAANSWG
jgi:hypothetical protein